MIPGMEYAIPAGISFVGNLLNAGAQNKATREQNQIQREGLQLAREGDRRSAETDAFRKLAQMAYLKGGGAQEGPSSISYMGKDTTLPSYGFGPKAASPEQMKMAEELEKLLMSRLRAPVTPMSLPPVGSISQRFLDAMGKDDKAKQLEEFIRSQTTTPGY